MVYLCYALIGIMDYVCLFRNYLEKKQCEYDNKVQDLTIALLLVI
jgi:hypothetical protein